MSYRPKIKKLTKIIGGISGILHPINGESPAYYSLAVILSDDHTDMSIAAGLQKYRTIPSFPESTTVIWPPPCPSNRSWRKNSPMWKSPFCRW